MYKHYWQKNLAYTLIQNYMAYSFRKGSVSTVWCGYSLPAAE